MTSALEHVRAAREMLGVAEIHQVDEVLAALEAELLREEQVRERTVPATSEAPKEATVHPRPEESGVPVGSVCETSGSSTGRVTTPRPDVAALVAKAREKANYARVHLDGILHVDGPIIQAINCVYHLADALEALEDDRRDAKEGERKGADLRARLGVPRGTEHRSDAPAFTEEELHFARFMVNSPQAMTFPHAARIAESIVTKIAARLK